MLTVSYIQYMMLQDVSMRRGFTKHDFSFLDDLIHYGLFSFNYIASSSIPRYSVYRVLGA